MPTIARLLVLLSLFACAPSPPPVIEERTPARQTEPSGGEDAVAAGTAPGPGAPDGERTEQQGPDGDRPPAPDGEVQLPEGGDPAFADRVELGPDPEGEALARTAPPGDGPNSGVPAAPAGTVHQPEDGDPAHAQRAELGPDPQGEALAGRPPPPGGAPTGPAPSGGEETVPPPDGSMFPDAPQDRTVTPPTEGGPTERPPADHEQPCGDGVCDGPESEQPDLCPRDCQDKPVQGSDWCGDGICDALEQRNQSCAQDCEGARLHGPPEVGEGDDPEQGD